MTAITPYDVMAARQTGAVHKAIAEFWLHFTRHADAIDAMFSRKGAPDVDIANVMGALRDIDADLMWEFGPSDRGHTLCVTAEWSHLRRPLARAIIQAAPDLARWRFTDARPATAPAEAVALFEARFHRQLTLTNLWCETGQDNKVAVVAQGVGEKDDLFGQAEALISILLGEAAERDWLGLITASAATPSGFLGRLTGKRQAKPLDLAQVKADLDGQIMAIKATLPEVPYVAQDPETRQGTLATVDGLPDTSGRPDLRTFQTPSVPYMQAALGAPIFASANHSRLGEHFAFVKIARVSEHAFDLVDDRVDVENLLHAALSGAGAGGLVAGGHGADFVYIDVALTDLPAALDIVQGACATQVWANAATFHFLEAGLATAGLPVASLTQKSH